MGIPIISAGCLGLRETAKKHPELKELLDTETVRVERRPITIIPHRARDPPDIDATLHPERIPKDWKNQNIVETISQIASFPEGCNSVQPSFTYAEMFGGIGGFGVALKAMGGSCVFYSELEEPIRAVYSLNFDTQSANIHGDIYQVSDDQIPTELDLLVAGFPCQPFSSLGKQPGFECPKG